jgi:hypothetical protein
MTVNQDQGTQRTGRLSANQPETVRQTVPTQITPQLDAKLAKLADLSTSGGGKQVNLTIQIQPGANVDRQALDAMGAEVLSRVQKMLEDF